MARASIVKTWLSLKASWTKHGHTESDHRKGGGTTIKRRVPQNVNLPYKKGNNRFENMFAVLAPEWTGLWLRAIDQIAARLIKEVPPGPQPFGKTFAMDLTPLPEAE